MQALPTTVRFRTGTKYAPADRPRTDAIHFVLPESLTTRLIWEQAKREREMQSVAEQAEAEVRRAQRLIQGQIAVVRPGEDARKPDALMDTQPGLRPVIVVGGGEEHVEALQEMADEYRHYYDSSDAAAYRRQRTPRDMQAVWLDWQEMLARNKAGLKVYGAATKGQF